MRKPTHQAHREACDTQSALWRKVSPNSPLLTQAALLGARKAKIRPGFSQPPDTRGGKGGAATGGRHRERREAAVACAGCPSPLAGRGGPPEKRAPEPEQGWTASPVPHSAHFQPLWEPAHDCGRSCCHPSRCHDPGHNTPAGGPRGRLLTGLSKTARHQTLDWGE